jgi:hypothetical protein
MPALGWGTGVSWLGNKEQAVYEATGPLRQLAVYGATGPVCGNWPWMEHMQWMEQLVVDGATGRGWRTKVVDGARYHPCHRVLRPVALSSMNGQNIFRIIIGNR